ncbi:MAG: energy transducer TonB [bacterium]|nr:energy transducer TonB [bacterium]
MKFRNCLLAACLMTLSLTAAALEEESSFAYHLRVVRVSGHADGAGAALGWAADGGSPVVLPGDESWGSAEQLDALAATLGGESANPVTGFFVKADAGGVLHFERPVYLGEHVVDLVFRAEPVVEDDAHRMQLTLDTADGAPPLAEAELRARTDRTVAIAVPSPVEDDWLVLAVTSLRQSAAVDPQDRLGPIRTVGEDGVSFPVLEEKVEPTYPEAARRALLQGQVALQVLIDREGIPRAPMVLSMTPDCEELAASAVDAVSRWRYEPSTYEGKPIAVHFTVFVKFALE